MSLWSSSVSLEGVSMWCQCGPQWWRTTPFGLVLGQPSAHEGTRGERRSSGVCEGVDEAVSDVRVGLELI